MAARLPGTAEGADHAKRQVALSLLTGQVVERTDEPIVVGALRRGRRQLASIRADHADAAQAGEQGQVGLPAGGYAWCGHGRLISPVHHGVCVAGCDRGSGLSRSAGRA